MESSDKRQAIMQTAEKLFKSGRIHEVTLDEVAQKAHVGKGTIYLYFENKDDLFFQVATSGFDEMCALIREQVSQDDRFEDQLLQMCHAISAFFGKRREMLHMMVTEDARMDGCRRSLRERWNARRKNLQEAVSLVLSRGVTAGCIRSDIPVRTLAVLLMGLMRARAHDLGDLPEAQRSNQLIIDIFLNGSGRQKTS